MSPSEPLWAASIFDPAIQIDAEGVTELAGAYARSRTLASLGALPLVEGERLTLWRLRPLTVSERADVLAEVGEHRRALKAFRLACNARLDGATVVNGALDGGTLVERGAATGEQWAQAQADAFGASVVDELGSLALQRATVSPKAREPFKLLLS